MRVYNVDIQDLGPEHLRKWTLQLDNEFDSICYQFRIKLKRPLVVVNDSHVHWGEWDPILRRISISSNLIGKYSWDLVINVFKHEIAHQIVSEIYESNDGHGPLFQKACDCLGIGPEFRSASCDLPRDWVPWQHRPLANGPSPILERAKKLLALAGSDNENEACIAMKKVQELYFRYNLQISESDESSQHVYLIVNHKKKRLSTVSYLIVNILQNHYFVRVISYNLFDAQLLTSHRVFEILGTRENVLIAEYVYYFLLNRVEQLWKQLKPQANQKARQLKRSFSIGVMKGFEQKMNELAKGRRDDFGFEAGHENESYRREPMTESPSAQLVALDRSLDRFVRSRFPKTTQTSGSRCFIDRSVFNQGVSEGRRINVYKGVASQTSNSGRLLGRS